MVSEMDSAGRFILEAGGMLILFDEASWSNIGAVLLRLDGVPICSILTLNKQGKERVKELREAGVLR